MPTNPTKRTQHWSTKYNLDRIKATLEDMRPGMEANVAAVFPLITAMELRTKQVLDSLGLPTIDYPAYMNYARELWKMTRNEISGESAAIEAQTLCDKWVSRGRVQSALEAIRTQVFNIAAPVAP